MIAILKISRWLGQRKMLVVLVLLSASCHWLVMLLTQQELLPAKTYASEREFRVVWTPFAPQDVLALRTSGEQRGALENIFDPSLIIESSDRGFSALASRGMVAATYRWPRQVHQPQMTDPSYPQQVRAPEMPEVSLEQSVLARLKKIQAPSLEETADVFLSEQQAYFQILELRGALKDRRLLQPFQLPELASDPPSRPSVFRVAVDLEGRVRVVVLEPPAGSGNPEADEKAAELLRKTTFVPLNVTPTPAIERDTEPKSPHLDWGTAIIAWPPKPRTEPEPANVTPAP